MLADMTDYDIGSGTSTTTMTDDRRLTVARYSLNRRAVDANSLCNEQRQRKLFASRHNIGLYRDRPLRPPSKP